MNLGLYQRILLTATVPAFLIALVLTVYFTNTQVELLENQFKVRTEASAKRLANAMNYPVLSNNRNVMEKIADEALFEADATSVVVYDQNFQLMARQGRKLPSLKIHEQFSREVYIHDTKNHHRITVPIEDLYWDDVYDRQPDLIGYVEFEFSTAYLRLAIYAKLLFNIFLFIASFALMLTVAFFASRTISKPVTHMLETVNKIKDGDLDARVDGRTTGEMQALELGINSMAESLKEAYHDMQSSVDQATDDLRQTLETIEIQNIELDMARREALEASRIKTEFLANMSHEIRTPLNGVIGFTKLLRKSNLTRKQQDFVNTIFTSSEGLLTIINDILDFCKLEAGKLTLDHHKMSMRETVEDVLTMLAPAASVNKLELVPLIYADVPKTIISDQLRIKQVITNLVSNAIKFTSSGAVVVRVMFEQAKDKQTVLKVSVTDTGIGMNKEQQSAIFQAFSQADSSTARKFGGTGLGLVISKRLVEQMGGDIGLESEPQKGSTFWFTLKVEAASDSKNDIKDELSEKSILVFEPREKSRLAIEYLLKEWNVNADFAINKVDVLKQLEHKDYYAAICGVDENHEEQKLHLLIDIINNKCPTVVFNSSTDDSINAKLIEQKANLALPQPVKHKQLYNGLLTIHQNNTPAPIIIEQAPIKPKLNSDKANILCVDDNPANLKLISILLEGLGCDVIAVNSGEKAIDAFGDYDFDLVFMDVQMPNMDGVETTGRIRQLEPSSKHTPIIALTAHALAGEKENLISKGMDDYLTKPIDENQMQKAIKQWTGIEVFEVEQNQLNATEVESLEPELNPDEAMPFEGMKIFDTTDALAKAGNKLNLAQDMMNMLLDGLEEEQKNISMLLKESNNAALLEVVHKLHGATHYCGVPRLRKAAFDAETAIKQEETQKIKQLVPTLTGQIKDLITWSNEQDWNLLLELAAEDNQ